MAGSSSEQDAYIARVFGVDPANYPSPPATGEAVSATSGSARAGAKPAIDAEHASSLSARAAPQGGRPVLKKGDEGGAVSDLQTKLNAQGAALAVDGGFGTLTKQAVEQFQSTHAPLKVDGIVGQQTWTALESGPPKPPAPDTTPRRVVVTVTDGAAKSPIAGADVKIADQSGITDGAGQAILSLLPGKHPFGATASDFQQGIGDVDVTGADETQLQIELLAGKSRSISIGPGTPPPLGPGAQQQFSAFNDSGKDVSREVTWSSSDPKVLSITALGLAVAGSAPGTATVTAVLGGGSGNLVGAVMPSSAAVQVTVTAPTPTPTQANLVKITVIPADVVSATGIPGVPLDISFRAMGDSRNGPSRDVTNEVTWSATSVPPGVVTIGPTGTAEFNAETNAVITATNPANAQVTGSATLAALAPGKLPRLLSIRIEPARPPALTDQPLQLKAIGSFSDNKAHDVTHEVTWVSSDPNIVGMDPSAGGLAKPGSVSGPATITATHIDPNVSPASIRLTVKAPPPPPLVGLQKITVTPRNPLVPVGGSQQFAATGEFANGPPQDVTTKVHWASAKPNVASISAGGTATGKLAGLAALSANDLTNPQVSGSTLISVHPPGTPPVLQTIAVSPVNLTITNFNFVQFTAMGTFSDRLDRDVTNAVTWSASNANITIETTGIASAVSSGIVDIIAADPATGASDATGVAISLPTLTTVTVNPPTATILAGEGVQLSADDTFADGSTRQGLTTVTWTSSSPNVDVDPSGAAMGKQAGKAAVTATDNSTGTTGSASITVLQPVLRSITVTTNTPSTPSGVRAEFSAVGAFSDGHTEDVTLQVDWTSSSSDVVVEKDGGAIGRKPGSTVTITATAPNDPTISGSAALTILQPVLTFVRVSPNPAKVAVGAKVQFTAMGSFSDGAPPRDITTQLQWIAGPDGFVSVDGNGLATGLAAGKTFVLAKDASDTTFRSTNVEVTQ